MSVQFDTFRVCTYNIGSNSNDWISTNKPTDQTLSSAYIKFQEETAERLVSSADVFCLQEVYDVAVNPRPIIKVLCNNQFAIFHAEGRLNDCVIALDQRKFENFQNLSERLGEAQDDAAIVAATHIETRERLVFVSARAPGGNIEGDVHPYDAKGGDDYCRRIAEKLSHIGNTVFIGIDMNVSREKWPNRFNEFSPAFKLYRAGYPTNIKPDSRSFRERELDYFLIRTAKVRNSFLEFFRKQCSTAARVDGSPIQWDNNPSDHLPIIARVATTVAPSKFAQLTKTLSGIFLGLSGAFLGQSLVILGFFSLWYVFDMHKRRV